MRAPLLPLVVLVAATLPIASAVARSVGAPEPRAGFEFNPHCAAPPRLAWLSTEELGSRLRESGYEVVRVRMADDRCYAVRVRDGVGQERDLIVHPVTSQIVR